MDACDRDIFPELCGRISIYLQQDPITGAVREINACFFNGDNALDLNAEIDALEQELEKNAEESDVDSLEELAEQEEAE
jgi:hypothetical protein